MVGAVDDGSGERKTLKTEASSAINAGRWALLYYYYYYNDVKRHLKIYYKYLLV